MDTGEPTIGSEGERLYGRKRGRVSSHLERWAVGRLEAVEFPQAATRAELLAALGADPATARLILEIGCGCGDTLGHLAASYPQDRLIGLDPFLESVVATLKRTTEGGLSNARVLRETALRFLSTRLPPASLDRVVIYFPDPWPKRRHHKRRLVQPWLLELLASRMLPGGVIDLATDWQEYADQMLATLSGDSRFCNLSSDNEFSPPPSDWVLTRFQHKGLVAGRSTWHLAFARR